MRQFYPGAYLISQDLLENPNCKNDAPNKHQRICTIFNVFFIVRFFYKPNDAQCDDRVQRIYDEGIQARYINKLWPSLVDLAVICIYQHAGIKCYGPSDNDCFEKLFKEIRFDLVIWIFEIPDMPARSCHNRCRYCDHGRVKEYDTNVT